MTSEAGGVRLGDLLTQAGLLRPEELREAMQIAKHQSLPVGRVLIMSGFLSDGQLRAAVQAQSLLKDGVISLETVLQALSIVGKEEMALEDAFRQLGLEVQQSQPTNKLGELLLEAELVSREALDQALQQSTASGLPLGRILILTGAIVEPLLSSALNAQVLVRDHKITRDQALQGLRAARDRQISLEQSLAETGLQLPMHNTIRLGELLVKSGIMPDTNLMDYVEMGLVQEQPLGQILIAQGVINDSILTNALELQKMVAAGSLIGEQAALVLNMVASGGTTIEEVLKAQQPQQEPVVETVPLYQFLQLAGRITPQQIEEAVRTGTRDAQIMGLMLHKVGAIAEFEMGVALALNDFMAKNIVSVEQAIVALNYCITNQISLEDAFAQMGWFLNQPYNSYTSQSSAGAAPALSVEMAAGVAPVAAPPADGYSHAAVDPNATAQLPPVTEAELHLTPEQLAEQQQAQELYEQQLAAQQQQQAYEQQQAQEAQQQAPEQQTQQQAYEQLQHQYEQQVQHAPAPEAAAAPAEAFMPPPAPAAEAQQAATTVDPAAAQAQQAAPAEGDGAGGQDDGQKPRKRLADLVP
ncbi:MAG: hypothetical protein C0507_13935 [Cyanobacteria bacterium PR.3.49]|nr:hypothetical protein [Cyanobacteria bacterium PR.3.49]